MYSIYAIFEIYYTPPPFYIEIYFRRNYEQARFSIDGQIVSPER